MNFRRTEQDREQWLRSEGRNFRTTSEMITSSLARLVHFAWSRGGTLEAHKAVLSSFGTESKKKKKKPACQGGMVEECNKYWLERRNWEADCGRILNLNQTPEHCQSDSPASSVSESLMSRVREEDMDPSVLRSCVHQTLEYVSYFKENVICNLPPIIP